MALAIKQIASTTTTQTDLVLYTVPAGRIAKIIVSNLISTSGTASSKLVIGNLDLGAGHTFTVERAPVYLGAGQTVSAVRVAGATTLLTVQFAAIEETAS